MYGAKAIQIAKVAYDTWNKTKATLEKVSPKLEKAVMTIADDNSVALDDLDVPGEYQTEEFRKLVLSLSKNPLVA